MQDLDQRWHKAALVALREIYFAKEVSSMTTVRKVVERTAETEEVTLVCPFCNAEYDAEIDFANQTVTFDLAPDETFCQHFDPNDSEWQENSVVFYFKS